MPLTDSKILLVDADLLVYRCGFAAERKCHRVTLADGTTLAFEKKKELTEWAKANEGIDITSIDVQADVLPLEFALNNVNTVVDALVEKFPNSPIEMYITGKDNFRNSIATIQPYKGNRKDAPKPVHYDAIREFLRSKYGCHVVDGEEADDMVSIRSMELPDTSVIVSTDKDLDGTEGWHYNWVDKHLYYVSSKEAIRNFYTQVLTGDRTDNVRGIEGCGIKTAAAILKDFSSEKGMWQACLAAYTEAYPNGCEGVSAKQAAIETARLVYIRKKRNEMWNPP